MAALVGNWDLTYILSHVLFLSFLMSLPDQLSEQQTESLQVDVVQLQEHHHHGHCVLLTVDYHGFDTERDEYIRSFSYSLTPSGSYMIMLHLVKTNSSMIF